mmetsp:Transcript_20355/g.59022  ORF Transcript_20355/g.59022 Transcript_20355/m.59022 type:complete len:298 (+) Transcript_20355:435-1328(+)
MKFCASSLKGLCWKKRCETGTCPSAPWIVALGTVERKQKSVSGQTMVAWKGWPERFRISARLMARKIPMKRKSSPMTMIGSTLPRKDEKMPSVVRLPSMLKSTSWPKIQTPPMTLSTSCSSFLSAAAAKKTPVVMTTSSGWKREPSLKPMGTMCSPSWPEPRPKAKRATPRIIRNASAGAPVKTWWPRYVRRARLDMSQPLRPPSRQPSRTVAMIRRKFAATKIPILMSGWSAGCEKPVRIPKSARAKEASRGAQTKTSLGMGWPLKRTPNSFIFGITRPSPIATRMVPITKPSTGV